MEGFDVFRRYGGVIVVILGDHNRFLMDTYSNLLRLVLVFMLVYNSQNYSSVPEFLKKS